MFTSCGSSDFEQVDYYKNSRKTRIFLIQTNLTDSMELLNYGENLTHTDGASTEAYFYQSKEDIYPISSRTDLGQIYEVLSSSNYFAKYSKNSSGNSRLKFMTH